ncbi:MAG: hypothetical protein Q4P33_07345 [Flaviflexus sp.]|nr:hypothetical protein [Flaviflexus sp.]
MRVLLTAGATDFGTADRVAAWAAQPWPTVTARPLSDGGGDLCEVLADLTGGELGTLCARGQLIPTLATRGTWTADLTSWREDTALIGEVLRAGLEQSRSRIVLALSSEIVPDLGKAMLAELGISGTAELAALLADTDVVLLASSETSLLGPGGLPRELAESGRLPGQVAQELERDLVRSLPGATDQRRQLHGASLSATDPLSGVGGGAGFLLARVGARIERTGAWVVNHLVGDIAEADLIVAVTGDLGLDLPASVSHLSRLAAARGLPVVLVYGEGALLRHELARDGLSGAYSYGSGRDGLDETMIKVAQTWVGGPGL